VIIALGRGEPVEGLPDHSAVSTVTLCELHHGVLVADDTHRPGRLALLSFVERELEAFPLDAQVAPHYGGIVAASRSRGRRRPRAAEALIAATAISHGLDLYARDRDFERLELPNLKLV
jgi:predicted nucleic acid-binding protein